ncbi:hypothetical protein ABVK25_009568 [Lepraria finkii]|uniref:CN hydrolase domain-containing protein n=1 Tax=Lepraria finkii TaxID=1340010 RepID=A0ABR4AZ40_9LECA
MQHIAKEGRCFSIGCNRFSDDIQSHGGSCIIGPLGTFLTEPVWDKDAILYAELPRAALTEAKMDFDPVGSYSRPHVFQLKVNTGDSTNVNFV